MAPVSGVERKAKKERETIQERLAGSFAVSRLRRRKIHASVDLASVAERVCCFCALRVRAAPSRLIAHPDGPQSIAASDPIRVPAIFDPPPRVGIFVEMPFI